MGKQGIVSLRVSKRRAVLVKKNSCGQKERAGCRPRDQFDDTGSNGGTTDCGGSWSGLGSGGARLRGRIGRAGLGNRRKLCCEVIDDQWRNDF